MHIYPGIVLPVCWHNEDTNEAVRAGKEPKVSEYDVRGGTFYTIDYIMPFYDSEDKVDENDQGKEYAQLYSGGTACLLPMTYKECKAKIAEHMAKINKPVTDETDSKTDSTT